MPGNAKTDKILFVDDEPFIAEEASEALNDEGYHCIAVHSVDAAMEALNDNPDVAVIVTDKKMPGKTGVDLIEAVRAGVFPQMKFIVMSGHGNELDGLFRVGAKEYSFLRKPVNISELIETVKKVLGQPRPSIKITVAENSMIPD